MERRGAGCASDDRRREDAGWLPAPAQVAQWVATQGKTVHLTLIAGWNNANAGFNFDGGANGHMIVTVPFGAKIVATYRNAATTPHDVRIINYQKPLPSHTVALAFAGASAGGGQCGPPRRVADAGARGAVHPARVLDHDGRRRVGGRDRSSVAGDERRPATAPCHGARGRWRQRVTYPVCRYHGGGRVRQVRRCGLAAPGARPGA